MNNLEMELFKAAASTFEDMAFMYPMPEMEQGDFCPQASATVEFQGPWSGMLVVSAGQDLLQSLVGNMLGEDESTPRQQYDALGEVANVICGNVLPAVAGRKYLFHISAPTVEDAKTDETEPLPAARVLLPLDGGQVDLRLYVSR